MTEDARGERELAARLLAREAGGDQTGPGYVKATSRAFGQLYRRLAVVFGSDGFDALARRALHLATLDHPFLATVRVRTEPESFQLDGLETSVAEQEPAEVRAGTVAVLGYFFWLIKAFLGEGLFEKLMHGVWPDVRLREGRRDPEDNPG